MAAAPPLVSSRLYAYDYDTPWITLLIASLLSVCLSRDSA